jgi:hypothetical protein
MDKESSELHNENVTKQHAPSSALIKLAAINCTTGITYKLLHVQRSKISAKADMNVIVRYKHTLRSIRIPSYILTPLLSAKLYKI